MLNRSLYVDTVQLNTTNRVRDGTREVPMASTPPSTNWSESGNCRERDLDEMFVTGAAQNEAKRICRGCPVQRECLAEALDNRIEFGVWGGMTERERRALLRRHPNVNWASTLRDR